jgi:hypothetical protein
LPFNPVKIAVAAAKELATLSLSLDAWAAEEGRKEGRERERDREIDRERERERERKRERETKGTGNNRPTTNKRGNIKRNQSKERKEKRGNRRNSTSNSGLQSDQSFTRGCQIITITTIHIRSIQQLSLALILADRWVREKAHMQWASNCVKQSKFLCPK